MHITLKPVSHPELDDIVIDNGLFHVGRMEQPFCDYAEKLNESLSRRHARIFMQDSAAYIADLGSSNGTRVNDKPLKDAPLQLQHGDLVNFAGDLSYHVSLASAASDERTRLVKPLAIQLNLSSQNNAVDSILVSEFPFLISKDSEVFSRYKESVPEELGFLSRRHAHIYEQEGNLYIEDLGSTNGTFLNDTRISEQAKSLSTGDLIGLGGDYFVFKLDIIKEDGGEPDSRSQTLSQIQASSGQHTTFISTATSFLDIFCVEEEVEKENSQKQETPTESNTNSEKQEAEKSDAGPVSRFHRVKGFLQQLQSVLKDDTENPSHWRRIIAGVMLVGITLLFVMYLFNRDKREIESLCEDENYTACIKKADNYLSKHKNEDGIIPELATRALLKSLVPEWIKQLQNADFEAANSLLTQSRSMTSHHQEGLNILGLLERVGALDGYVRKRGGPEGSIQIFRDEEIITKLVEEWRANSDADRRMMARVVEHVPEFEALRGQVFSELRQLRNDKSLYLAAIKSFISSLQEKIANGDKGLLKEIDRFSSRYPRVAGLELLREDAEKYTQLQQGNTGEDLLNRLQAYQDVSFQTHLFQSELKQMKKENLPPEEIATRFTEAQDLWNKGMVVDAVKTLGSVSHEAWIKKAQAIIERYEDIASRYETLGGQQGADDYQDKLFIFHGSLDPVKDRFFLAAIEGEFAKYRDASKSRADNVMQAASEGLTRYRNSGGIQGLQRLEEQVTEGFKKQSSLLSEIHAQITQAQQVYKILKLELNKDQQKLCESIEREMALQRSALKDLSSILSNKILESKLKLLAEP
ncbi:MAG: hypothetical protein DSZ28_08690 [Thiothrix sp.]|nr:MAG: hypothetical protein DSZ28_08690 [Thiothrix sp.]